MGAHTAVNGDSWGTGKRTASLALKSLKSGVKQALWTIIPKYLQGTASKGLRVLGRRNGLTSTKDTSFPS